MSNYTFNSYIKKIMMQSVHTPGQAVPASGSESTSKRPPARSHVDSTSTPWRLHGDPMATPWRPHGDSMRKPNWESIFVFRFKKASVYIFRYIHTPFLRRNTNIDSQLGFLMESPWGRYGVAMGSPWSRYGVAMGRRLPAFFGEG